MQAAVLCGDRAAPRDPETSWRDIGRDRAAHPLFGPMTDNIPPCASWDRPRERPTRVDRDVPALLVAATGDPRTTCRATLKPHARLPASRLVTLPGAMRQGLYGEYGDARVDDQVNRYPATGKAARQGSDLHRMTGEGAGGARPRGRAPPLPQFPRSASCS
ncbi:alpha/beta hydrolase [Streptomyces sp. NPDC058195]|uniref:alpha/beta hydrolase n=1 Tax=Streptomyces sp. NPDC058195 TaxID=3346375 RepID=UPI0036F0BE42